MIQVVLDLLHNQTDLPGCAGYAVFHQQRQVGDAGANLDNLPFIGRIQRIRQKGDHEQIENHHSAEQH